MIAVPLPGALSTRILPRWASTISLQADRPRPVPPLPVSSGPDLVENRGSKIRRITSGVIPQPVSRTIMSTSPEGSSYDSRRIRRPPPAIACRAFTSRFKSTCWSCPGLADTFGTGANSRSTWTRYFISSRSSSTSTSSINRLRFTGSNLVEPDRDMPSTLAVIFAARVPADRMRSSALSRVGWSRWRSPILA